MKKIILPLVLMPSIVFGAGAMPFLRQHSTFESVSSEDSQKVVMPMHPGSPLAIPTPDPIDIPLLDYLDGFAQSPAICPIKRREMELMRLLNDIPFQSILPYEKHSWDKVKIAINQTFVFRNTDSLVVPTFFTVMYSILDYNYRYCHVFELEVPDEVENLFKYIDSINHGHDYWVELINTING